MEQIGMFEAKTRFSEIAKRVKDTGRPIRVTNRGEDMVEITPVSKQTSTHLTKAEAIAELEALRKTLPKSSRTQIKASIAFGRR